MNVVSSIDVFINSNQVDMGPNEREFLSQDCQGKM